MSIGLIISFTMAFCVVYYYIYIYICSKGGKRYSSDKASHGKI